MTDNKSEVSVLREPHSFSEGDNVIINNKTGLYKGVIYSIVNLPINPHIDPLNRRYTDYFYVKFPRESYNKIIQQGWDIIYNHKREIVSKITKKDGIITNLWIRAGHFSEYEGDIDRINAILVWRVGWNIILDTNSSKS